jgi:hypothetical protein
MGVGGGDAKKGEGGRRLWLRSSRAVSLKWAK